jgi:Ca2+:H+ antiporter
VLAEGFNTLGRRERITLGIALATTLTAAILHFAEANSILVFVLAGAALAILAALVGDATEQLGTRLGPGATGVLQSALGNLPELFVGIFALRAGLTSVVQAALIGSILGNSVLVMGLAFLVGGLRHGPQRFGSEAPRRVATLTLLAVAALAIPTLAHLLHTPAEPHADVLSAASAVVLLAVFIVSNNRLSSPCLKAGG